MHNYYSHYCVARRRARRRSRAAPRRAYVAMMSTKGNDTPK